MVEDKIQKIFDELNEKGTLGDQVAIIAHILQFRPSFQPFGGPSSGSQSKSFFLGATRLGSLQITCRKFIDKSRVFLIVQFLTLSPPLFPGEY